jgi:scyllo-inositol 2-dehydrogenase (NADP+)
MTKPISTALLSYGMSGLVFHAPLLKAHGGFHLTTICQRKEPTALGRWPDVKIVKQVEDIWSDPTIELVVVNTPNETHFEYTRKVLESGKHAVVEKPMTVTSKEADELIQLAKKQNKFLTVFQNRRWDGDFLTVRNVLADNLVGKVAEFEAHYDRFRNYIEPNTWKEKDGLGSGILYNLGSHMLDQVVVLFGMPLEVDARMGIQREGGQVDDFYDIRLRYENFYAIVKSSYLVKEQGPRYILHGSQGSFIKYGLDPQEQALKEGVVPGGKEWGADPAAFWGKLNNAQGEKRIETIPGNYLAFYQSVYSAIREGKELEVRPEESRDVIRLIEACYESNRLRAAVKM